MVSVPYPSGIKLIILFIILDEVWSGNQTDYDLPVTRSKGRGSQFPNRPAPSVEGWEIS